MACFYVTGLVSLSLQILCESPLFPPKLPSSDEEGIMPFKLSVLRKKSNVSIMFQFSHRKVAFLFLKIRLVMADINFIVTDH